LAEDRAEQLKREPDRIAAELEKRLRKDLAYKGDFDRIHPVPHSGADVPDDLDSRLVVLGIDNPYTKDGNSPAEFTAKAILESRGNAPRLYRNTLVFLAADKSRLQDLDEAGRKVVAWESILAERENLNLSPYQVTQAENQKVAAEAAVTARLPETYQWLLVPVQGAPQANSGWESLRLSGTDALAVRASKKLRTDELYLTSFAPTRLRMELDRVPLWRGDHVSVRQLVEDFARYLYLPRLKDSSVLLNAISDGMAITTWVQDTFAFADAYDDSASRYKGLRGGKLVSLVDSHSPALLVKPSVAQRQMDAESAGPAVTGTHVALNLASTTGAGGGARQSVPTTLRRFHGTVQLDAARVGRDASRIADEVIAHLAGQVGVEVTVTLDIEAKLPNGATDQIVRTVTENSRTLKFTSHGFESD
jgi:hypothetical protein